MRNRLFIAVVCTLVLPMLASNSRRATHQYPSVTALAGHTTAGERCECGGSGCICEPGEIPHSQAAPTRSNPAPSSSLPSSKRGLSEFSLLGALMFALLIRLSLR